MFPLFCVAFISALPRPLQQPSRNSCCCSVSTGPPQKPQPGSKEEKRGSLGLRPAAQIDRKMLVLSMVQALNQRSKGNANPKPSLTLSSHFACSNMKRRDGEHLEMMLHAASQTLLSPFWHSLQYQRTKLAPFRSSRVYHGFQYGCGVSHISAHGPRIVLVGYFHREEG